ncbi:ionic transporter y4hA, partial [Streptomyces albidoflavus]|uniref:calcium:proton antiporter n=1 Tax=Streptomyces albidoflavus TaxID=1886 RepID=UPI00349B813D
LVVLIVLATLSLVLPNFTISGQGQAYDARQLAFVSIVTLVLYGVFLYIQTTLHRDYFVSLGDEEETGQTHVPSNRIVGFSVVLLLFALLAVVLLAKKFAAVVEVGRTALELPVAVTGVVVAFLILLPEGVAAVHAAKRDDLQKALNLAMGSSLATIGLTIPAVACVTIVLGKSLTLGLGSVDTILLVLVLLTSTLTFGQGRTNVLYGFVHLVIFATFLFLTAFP